METLKNHFYNNMGKNDELINLSVFTKDSEELFINDFDQFCSNDTLPRWVMVSNKKGSIYGKMIQTSELFVQY